MAWWQRQFGTSTRGKIVALLRRGRKSVEDLASALGITDNAVRAQLSSLVRDGVVNDVGARRVGAVGKPPTLFAISDQADSAFSGAYAPTLTALLDVLGERHTPVELDAIMREVGSRLAANVNGSARTLDGRVHSAVGFLADLGAVADVEHEGARWVVHGRGCPLGNAVDGHPETCRVVEQLLSDATGAHVRAQCVRDDGRPHCSFEVSARS